MIKAAKEKTGGRSGHFHKPDFHKAGVWFGRKVSSMRSRAKGEKGERGDETREDKGDEAKRKLDLSEFYDPYDPYDPFEMY